MRRLAVLLLVTSVAMIAVAQDAPKAEVFGGYLYLNQDMKGLIGRQSFNGWNADVAGHLTNNFSIVADIGGSYKTIAGEKTNLYSFLFGPRISGTSGKVTPFAEALFGAARASAGGVSDSKFAMALGGGVDVNANSKIAIRLAKFDYMLIRTGEAGIGNLNNIRLATGIVFKF